MQKKYNAILFDMDGTLADTDPLIVEAFLRLYDKYGHGRKRSVEEIYYFSGPSIKKVLKEGYRTIDIMPRDGSQVEKVGTAKMGDLICERI